MSQSAEAVKEEKASSKKIPVVRIVLILLISLVLGLTVYNWNARRLVGNALPMPFGFGVAVVLSGSMEPTLSVNDLVFVSPVKDWSTLAEGDVIVYQNEGELIIHRIIELSEDGETFVTQGDANNIADEPIFRTQIKGKLSFHLPFIGLIVKGLKSPVGIIVILAAAIFLMHESWKGEKKKGDEQVDAIKEEIRRLKEEQEAALKASSEKNNDQPLNQTHLTAEGEDKHE